MTISIKRYVNIASGVGGQSAVPRRSFMLRQFSQNALIPAGAVVTFSQLSDVALYFGTAVDEYKVAEKYFGFVSKGITRPDYMSVAGWNAAALAPAVFGSAPASLTALKLIVAGTLAISVSGVTSNITALNFGAAVTLADIASTLQTRIRADANPMLTTATVTYESNRGVFILRGATATPGATLSMITGGGADASASVGWSTGLQIEAAGVAAQTPDVAFQNSAAADDNFGSFVFSGAVLPTDPQHITVAAANHALNNKFIYCVPATSANVATLAPSLIGYSGTALTVCPVGSTTDHAETVPAEILAAIKWERPGASQNFMYYRFGNRTFTADTDAVATSYDNLRANYIGRTQTAGQKISFFQTGFLMGDATAATDMAVYVGEMWLKDALSSEILGGFLALPSMPANNDGRITLLSLMQGPLDQALINGVVSVGKNLDNTQKAYITQVTASPDAWRQIESKGYWVDAVVRSEVVAGTTRYYADYILVYGKNDQLRRVTGSDILI